MNVINRLGRYCLQIVNQLMFFLLIINLSLFAQIESVKIGDNYWTTKNLNVDRFNNGDVIPEAITGEDWADAARKKQPAWCYYDYDIKNGEIYGKLYNWYAVNDPRGLAPDGWHVPTRKEWEIIINQFGDEAGLILKNNAGWDEWETGGPRQIVCRNCLSWSDEYRSKVACHTCKDSRRETIYDPIIKHAGNGKNSLGFNALPGGVGRGIKDDYRLMFRYAGSSAVWWSSDYDDYYNAAYTFYINTSSNKFYSSTVKLGRYQLYSEDQFYKYDALSVRLVKNDEKFYKVIQERKQRLKDSLLANQTFQNFNASLSEISLLIDNKKLEEAKTKLQNLKSKYKDVEIFGEFKISGLHTDIKKIEDKLELTARPLSEIENLFVGEWVFKSKYIYLNDGQIYTLEENWLVNADRTYVYKSRFKKYLLNKYFEEFLEKVKFVIFNDTSSEILLVAHINEENGKPSSRIDKMKFDKISNTKASRTLNFKSAKYPVKTKGKKVNLK
jgi:hypothetical protein